MQYILIKAYFILLLLKLYSSGSRLLRFEIRFSKKQCQESTKCINQKKSKNFNIHLSSVKLVLKREGINQIRFNQD